MNWNGAAASRTPLYAGRDDTHYRVIGWEEALDRVARQLRDQPPDQNFFYASGRSSNEAGFLLQLFARLYGTNYVNNCSYYCHQASGVGLGRSLGTGTATVTLEDVEKTDLFVLIGGNPASNHPRLMRTLMNVRRRGGHVLVINPVKEIGLVNFSVPSDVRSLLFGSKIASLYVQPHIGGDIALLTGVAKIVLERNAVDARFLAEATEGFEAYQAHVRGTSWETIEQASGVDRATMAKMAEMYLRAPTAVFGWTMGITHHEHGVANVQTIVNLALLRGMVGRPRAGLLPIRGHSNVQGIGSVGVAPALKQKILDNLETYLKVKLPTRPGLDTMACMEAAEQGAVRSAVCLGGNLFGSNPDATFALQALSKLELVAYLSTTLNTGHAWGRARETLILPVRARDEEPEADDAGIDVQLRAPQRRRTCPLRGAAQRSRGHRLARRARAGREKSRGLEGTAKALSPAANDRTNHPRLREDCRHRSARMRSSRSTGGPSTRRASPRRRARRNSPSMPSRRRPAPTGNSVS